MPLTLTDGDSSLLHGEAGATAAAAMQVLAAFSRAVGAERLLDITRAHIDGCLYHGQASLDFVERLVAGGGRVRVPTTLNVGSIDLIHPELIRLSPAQAQRPGRRLMQAHEELGCEPSFTCAPYQTRFRPVFGEQIAWGESNAIVFANSVIGARTNRYGDFIDLCCALTGRAPAWGLHLDEPRRGQLLFRLTGFPATRPRPTDALFVAVGLIIGCASGDRIPVIEGLADAAPRGPAESAWARPPPRPARSGCFTRSASRRRRRRWATRFGGGTPDDTSDHHPGDVARALEQLSTVPDGTRDHGGLPRHAALLAATNGIGCCRSSTGRRRRRAAFPSTSTPAGRRCGSWNWMGASTSARELSVIPVIDTCTYLTPILERLDGAVMTNSGKWAHYAPGNLGVQVAFG